MYIHVGVHVHTSVLCLGIGGVRMYNNNNNELASHDGLTHVSQLT